MSVFGMTVLAGCLLGIVLMWTTEWAIAFACIAVFITLLEWWSGTLDLTRKQKKR